MHRSAKIAMIVGVVAFAGLSAAVLIKARQGEARAEKTHEINDNIVADANRMNDLIPQLGPAMHDIKIALRVSEQQAASAMNTKFLPLLDQYIALQADEVKLWDSIAPEDRSDLVIDGTNKAHAFLKKLQDTRAKFAAASARLAQGDASPQEVSDMFEDAAMTLLKR